MHCYLGCQLALLEEQGEEREEGVLVDALLILKIVITYH